MTGKQSKCQAPGCERNVNSRGYCFAHYHRIRRHGSLENIRDKNSELDSMFKRLAEQIAIENEEVVSYEEEKSISSDEELEKLLKAAYDLVRSRRASTLPRRKGISANAKSRKGHRR
jgi:hypothetical protein